jgi:hypothetical protein
LVDSQIWQNLSRGVILTFSSSSNGWFPLWLKTKKKKNTPRQKHWIEDISFVISYPIHGVATKCHQFQSNPKHEKLMGIGGQKLTCQKMMNKKSGFLLSHLPLCTRSTQAIDKP